MQTKAISVVLSAVAAVACFGAAEPQSEAVARPGQGVTLTFKRGGRSVSFGAGVYSESWRHQGARGGGSGPGGAEAPRPFSLETVDNGGDNVAVVALRFSGQVEYRQSGDGVEALWSATPDRDGRIAELYVEGRLGLADCRAGFRVDGKAVAVPVAEPDSPHLFHGTAKRFEALDGDGAPWLALDFPEGASVLIQDNRKWNNPCVVIRLVYAEGAVTGGKEYALHAVASAPGAAMALDDPPPLKMAAGPDWIPVAVPEPGEDWIVQGSALDLSVTIPRHEPAGAFGRVVAVGDHMELEGRPGEEIKFCGVNIVSTANLPDPEACDRFAANLARFGANAVRLHHHDRWMAAAKDGGPRADGTGLVVDDDTWNRFDTFTAACIRHGLYLTTDLFCTRAHAVTWRALGIDRPGKVGPDAYKILVAFHEGAFQNLADWTRLFLSHVNPHTGRSLAQEPALAGLALVNEGNLGNWGTAAIKPIPGAQEAWREWLARRRPDLLARDGSAPWPGDVYDERGADPLAGEFARFLADREDVLRRRLTAVVRDELGCPVPVSCLSSWYNPVSYLGPRTNLDYVDDHGYIDHPRFLDKAWQLPVACNGETPLAGGDGSIPAARRRLFGKPFWITEWNWAAPNPGRYASGLVMGALAARQDWSGLYRFAWSHDHFGVEAPGSIRMRYFDLHADPTQCATERATLCLFLRGDLSPLPRDRETACVFSRDVFAAGPVGRIGSPLSVASPWTSRLGVRLGDVAGGAPHAVFPAADASASTDDGDFADAPGDGTFRVSCRLTAGGAAESGSIEAGPLAFTLSDAPAAVWVSSVDGSPISESGRLLLTHVTDSHNTGAVFDTAEFRTQFDFGVAPALMRRGRADVSLALAPGKWRVWRLSPTGLRLAETPSTWDEAAGRLSFTADTAADPAAATFLYEIALD